MFCMKATKSAFVFGFLLKVQRRAVFWRLGPDCLGAVDEGTQGTHPLWRPIQGPVVVRRGRCVDHCLVPWFCGPEARPRSISIWASGSKQEIMWAMDLKWPWCFATSGLRISDRSSGIWLHSMSVGSTTLNFPCRDSAMNPMALLPDVSVTPAHVRRV